MEELKQRLTSTSQPKPFPFRQTYPDDLENSFRDYFQIADSYAPTAIDSIRQGFASVFERFFIVSAGALNEDQHSNTSLPTKLLR